MSRVIDYSALRRVIRPDERASFMQSQSSLLEDYKWMRVGYGFGVIALYVFSLFLLLQGFYGAEIGLIVSGIIFAGLGLLGLLFGVTALRAHVDRRIRFLELSSTNAWRYTPRVANVQEQGLLFQQGRDRVMTDVFDAQEAQGHLRFQFGNYRYTIGHGRYQRTYQWGFVAIKLQRRLPHMLLDATANNMRMFGFNLSNLPATFTKDQVLSLEGDFNSYFTLYAPKEYKRDAFYVFTPDLMALLIDTTKTCDVEVIDDMMYVYMPPLDISKEAVVRRLISITDTVGVKTHRQTAQYADEYVGDRSKNVIAPAGARLRKRSFVAGIVIIIVIIAVVNMFDIIGAFI